jgi:hypothetical protein
MTTLQPMPFFTGAADFAAGREGGGCALGRTKAGGHQAGRGGIEAGVEVAAHDGHRAVYKPTCVEQPLGFCIGGPFIWNLLKHAGDRVVAAVPVQPSGYRHEMPDLSYNNNMKGWGPELCERRPDITMAQVTCIAATAPTSSTR